MNLGAYQGKSKSTSHAEEIDPLHVIQRVVAIRCDPGVRDQDRFAFRPGEGDVEPVLVEEELEPSRTEFSGAGSQRDDDDGGLLALEFVDGADS